MPSCLDLPVPCSGHRRDWEVWVWWEQKNPPSSAPLTVALKQGGRKKKKQSKTNYQNGFSFTPSNDILTASILGMALLFSLWSSINALPQNSCEPAGLFTPQAVSCSELPQRYSCSWLGLLSPAGPQASSYSPSPLNEDNLPARGGYRCLKASLEEKAACRHVFHQFEGAMPERVKARIRSSCQSQRMREPQAKDAPRAVPGR